MCEACAEFVRTIHGTDDNRVEKLKAETELELARIHRDEAIQLAKIAQKMNQDDNEAELVQAETAAEVQADVIDDLTQPEQETVIVTSEDSDLDGEPVEEAEEEIAEAPPVVEPEPVSRRNSSWSYWG